MVDQGGGGQGAAEGGNLLRPPSSEAVGYSWAAVEGVEPPSDDAEGGY